MRDSDDDGDFRGSDAEIANALCAEMRARCKFISTPFVQLITALQEGSIDAIVSNMSATREREQLVDFTDVYRTVPNRFVARRHAALEISPEGLAGKRLGVRRNSVHDRYATDKYGTTAIIRRYSELAELFVDLALGRNDAVLVEVPAARTSFLETRLGADYEFVGPELSDERWFGTGIGIAVRKGDAARREAFNQALAAIRADGTYQRIIDRYFNVHQALCPHLADRGQSNAAKIAIKTARSRNKESLASPIFPIVMFAVMRHQRSGRER